MSINLSTYSKINHQFDKSIFICWRNILYFLFYSYLHQIRLIMLLKEKVCSDLSLKQSLALYHKDGKIITQYSELNTRRKIEGIVRQWLPCALTEALWQQCVLTYTYHEYGERLDKRDHYIGPTRPTHVTLKRI